MYDLKGSLHGSVGLSDFAKEAYSKHHIYAEYRHNIGRIPLRRKD